MNRNIVTTVLLSIFISISGFAQDKKWSLEECVNYAMENNISIKQTALDTDLADQDLINAKGNFLPNLNGYATQDWNFGTITNQRTGNQLAADTRGNSFGLNTGVTLFNGFRNTSIYKQAQLGIESSELQLNILKDNISVNVVNQYLNILLNKENLKVAEEQVAITEKQVIQVSELVDSGVRPRADLFEVEAQLASDRERLTNVQNSLDLAILGLTQLLQISNEGFDVEDIELSLPEVLVKHKSSNEIYDYALQNRPEIKKAELDIENSILAIDIAKSAYYPTLSFGAGLRTYYQHFQGQEDVLIVGDINSGFDIISNDFWDQIDNNLGYNLGFRLDIPIFNRMQTKVSVDKAKINKERIAYSLDQAKQDLRSTIEQAYTDAKAAFKQFEASQVSLNAQKEAFKNAQESYNSGVMNSFEFEQVRNRLVNAEANLINAKYNFVFTTKVLDFYLGKPLTD
ncbi:TolC family protein [Xanthomarina gelatinilytica]|uniref:TolC family protein n=1 Tax=Xanthomarina gelatinilytica TaxID=1137281 RepID=UPI003AA984BD